MNKWVLCVVLLAMLSGCSAAKIWYKPEITVSEFKQHRFRCMAASGYTGPDPSMALMALGTSLQSAGASLQGHNPYPAQALQQAQISAAAGRANLFTACMHAFGYQQFPAGTAMFNPKTGEGIFCPEREGLAQNCAERFQALGFVVTDDVKSVKDSQW
jgi:hypothetical protein